ncbi:MAG: protein kinase [Polyangiaceae bacterium]|nr:protein kinase [Polyangiaceae bacterium]
MTRSQGLTEEPEGTRDEEFVGRAVGKYTLVRVIGKGGMGVVYEAQNTAIGKRVAIKLVSAELAKNKDAVRRFQREAQAASAVESAHIVDIFDAGTTDDGVPFIVMELLRGEDLGHRIKRLGRLEIDDAVHITLQILRGLFRAHEAGIVHRDLKPDNVFLVDRDDDPAFVKVLDFGISKVARRGETPVQTLTKQGTVLGTPFYMSPEQAQGLPDTDGRADLWSVGAILYECLSGRAPHTGASYEQVIVAICTKDALDIRVHNPEVSEPIAKVIAKALAREREDRFADAREMLEALADASGTLISLSPRSSDEPQVSSGGRRRSSPSSPSGNRVRPVSGAGPKSNNTPHAPVQTGAFEDTVEVLKGGGPSRVGWSTSSNSAARRDRKRFMYLALATLVVGLLSTLFIALKKPSRSDSTSGTEMAEVTVKLRANAPNARFVMNGKQIVGGLLRGRRGESRTVTVEADGYVPIEAVVSLEPGQDMPEIQLTQKTAAASNTDSNQPGATGVVVSPSSNAVQDAPGANTAPDAVAQRNGNRVGNSKPTTSSSAKPNSAPTVVATAAPTVSVIPLPSSAPPVPTLTIKRD